MMYLFRKKFSARAGFLDNEKFFMAFGDENFITLRGVTTPNVVLLTKKHELLKGVLYIKLGYCNI